MYHASCHTHVYLQASASTGIPSKHLNQIIFFLLLFSFFFSTNVFLRARASTGMPSRHLRIILFSLLLFLPFFFLSRSCTCRQGSFNRYAPSKHLRLILIFPFFPPVFFVPRSCTCRQGLRQGCHLRFIILFLFFFRFFFHAVVLVGKCLHRNAFPSFSTRMSCRILAGFLT